jgi:hypothetical protein
MTSLITKDNDLRSTTPPSGAVHVAFVDCLPDMAMSTEFDVPKFGNVIIDRPRPDEFERYMHELDAAEELAVVFAGSNLAPPDSVISLRRNKARVATRVYIVGDHMGDAVPGWAETFDVEDFLAPSAMNGFAFSDRIEVGLRAYHSLTHDSLYTDYYLDMTFNKVFDWFETTRWDWKDVSFDDIKTELLTTSEIDYLTEAAIIEFGTLPGAHNFLREWQGETSFSSWALMWGAEEARHSLVQARYLDKIGIKVRSKHALYKREPYPIGDTQTGTLVMNIISEARAAEMYRRLAAQTREPVIKRIWKLLSHDESRHCRAFYVFAQELCQANKANQIAALKMGYVWLADRSEGLKHPAGHFYPHSTSADGIKRVEAAHEGATDAADAKVMATLRRLAEDDSIETARDIKRKIRSMI